LRYLFFNLYKIFKVHKFLLDFLFADCVFFHFTSAVKKAQAGSRSFRTKKRIIDANNIDALKFCTYNE